MNQDYLNDMEEEKPIDWKTVVMEYLIYWPAILTFLCLAMAGTWVFLRFQEPQYNINSTVLIKQEDKSKGAASAMNALVGLSDMGMMSMANNFDNELEIIQSRTLIEKVVKDLSLYVNYKKVRPFSYNLDVYKNTPVKVWMSPEEAGKLYDPLKLEVALTSDGKTLVKGVTHTMEGDEISFEEDFEQLPAVYVSPVGTLTFTRNENYQSGKRVEEKAEKKVAAEEDKENKEATGDKVVKDEKETADVHEEMELEVNIYSPLEISKIYKKHLSGIPTSKQTSIVSLNFVDSNPQRAIDFINALVNTYNRDANDDKNTVAGKTAEFIEARIGIINKELGNTENELANYKQKAGLTNVEADAELALQSNSKYEAERAENATQLRLVAFLKEYIQDAGNEYEVIPENVGLKDMSLSSSIGKFNELIVERKRLLRVSNENNPAIQNMNSAIRAMRSSVLASVRSVEKGLEITRKNLKEEAQKFETKISNAPHLEKGLAGFKRQQEIKANLYLMLLQKREENAITLAATANNGRMVEVPVVTERVAPKGKVVYMAGLILGIACPVGFIFLMGFFQIKIENRGDVEKITDVNIIGDIPAQKLKNNSAIVVNENQNGMMEEIYRNIRTNIQFMLEKGEKVVLFSSTTPGEGKTFNALNTALSFAAMDKKVLIMGMDIRKPGLNKVLRISHREKGITQYLSNPEEYDILELCRPSDVSKNLYVLPGGAVPPNPTELVARETLDTAFEILRKNFDYIIVDTAPIGIVTDTQLIAREVDMSVYVCRAGYTNKADFAVVNKFKREKILPKMAVLINGINMESRRNGYYYGYGKYGSYGKYGYGVKYGYGYGYGQEDEKKKK